jgi:hypothetical protein
VHRDAELTFGEAAREKPVRTDQHGDARQIPCEHERLVAGRRYFGQDALGRRNDSDSWRHLAAGVPSRKNRWARAPGLQEFRDVLHGWRLAGPTDSQVPYAHDRAGKPPAP